MTAKNIKSTLAWQKRRRDAGLCVQCGKPLDAIGDGRRKWGQSKIHCTKCLEQRRLYTNTRVKGGGR